MSYIQNKLDEELFKLTFWNKITIAEQESLRFFCLAMNKDYHNHIVEKIKNKDGEYTVENRDGTKVEFLEKKLLLSLLQDTNK